MKSFYRKNRLIEWDPENPVITCLMSVYNGDTYLREAIDSILDQTYTNFEFLIINDGSMDDTVFIIESYDDPRIRLIHNEENIGLTKSLNKGIDLSKGKYIARMDADDVSMRHRFEEQLNVIQKSNIQLLGTQAKFSTNYITKYPTKHNKIIKQLFKSNCFIHSSIMTKKEILVENKYNPDIKYAQDYELWTRLVLKVKVGNIDQVLHWFRKREREKEKCDYYSEIDDKIKATYYKKYLNEVNIIGRVIIGKL